MRISLESEPKIVVKRTVTLKFTSSMKSYPDMTPEEALEYEKNRNFDDKVESFIDGLEYSEQDEIKMTEEFNIVYE